MRFLFSCQIQQYVRRFLDDMFNEYIFNYSLTQMWPLKILFKKSSITFLFKLLSWFTFFWISVLKLILSVPLVTFIVTLVTFMVALVTFMVALVTFMVALVTFIVTLVTFIVTLVTFIVTLATTHGRLSDILCRLSDFYCRLSDTHCHLSDAQCHLSDVFFSKVARWFHSLIIDFQIEIIIRNLSTTDELELIIEWI